MEKEILKQIRKDYSLWQKMKKGNYKNDDAELIKHLKENYNFDDKDFDFICYVISHYGYGLIEDTNNLWFYYEELPFSKLGKLYSPPLTIENKNSLFIVYLDLENSSKSMVIKKENQSLFEEYNKVIYGKRDINDSIDRHYNTRYRFFSLCLKYGQEKAVLQMLYEEHERQREAMMLKTKLLQELDEKLKYNLITQDNYDLEKVRILAKK